MLDYIIINSMNNRYKIKFKPIVVGILIDNNLYLPIDITFVYNNIDT